jgi:hypothetical protein
LQLELNNSAKTVVKEEPNEHCESSGRNTPILLNELLNKYADQLLESIDIVPHPDDVESEDSSTPKSPASESSNDFVEKRKTLNECYVLVHQLPIQFVKSDTESEKEEDVCKKVQHKNKKRKLSKNVNEKSDNNNDVEHSSNETLLNIVGFYSSK